MVFEGGGTVAPLSTNPPVNSHQMNDRTIHSCLRLMDPMTSPPCKNLEAIRTALLDHSDSNVTEVHLISSLIYYPFSGEATFFMTGMLTKPDKRCASRSRSTFILAIHESSRFKLCFFSLHIALTIHLSISRRKTMENRSIEKVQRENYGGDEKRKRTNR